MITRVLRPEEYPRFALTDFGAFWSQIADEARVIVVEDHGQIVGCQCLLPVLHAEGLWIHPAHRGKSSVARRLWAAIQREVRDTFHATGFVTAATTEPVRDLLDHLGAARMPGQHFAVRIASCPHQS